MTYVITEPCIGTKDASCVEVCPVDCIHSTDEAAQYFINPDECIDCGVCAEVCPVEAIFFEDDVPNEWADFRRADREFFTELGSPGGASNIGPVDSDHAVVAELPVSATP